MKILCKVGLHKKLRIIDSPLLISGHDKLRLGYRELLFLGKEVSPMDIYCERCLKIWRGREVSI